METNFENHQDVLKVRPPTQVAWLVVKIPCYLVVTCWLRAGPPCRVAVMEPPPPQPPPPPPPGGEGFFFSQIEVVNLGLQK